MEYNIIHNSQEITYRSPFGAAESGEEIKIVIKAQNALEVYLIIYKNEGMKESSLMKKDEEIFYYSISTKDFLGNIYYHFKVILKDGSQIYYGNNIENLGGEGMVYTYNPSSFQITVYNPWIIPNWFKEGIVYQIFVDSFHNGNENGKVLNPKDNSFIYGSWYDEPMYIKDHNGKVIRWAFYGGNLRGVINKLDYIKSLGTTIIYLNPIFESSSPHKYDTGDYEKIDPMFGDEETFKELCDKSHSLGIKIILDGVFSHTGSDSKYFNKYKNYEELGAYNSKESKYYEWYRFKNYPNDYECWWGVDSLPNVDEMNEGYLNYIVKDDNSVISKWMRCGVDGWRLDVADELPDEFIKVLRKKAKEINKESIVLGEVWEDASNKVSYGIRRNYVLGEELDSVTNYPLRNIILDFLKGDINGVGFKRRVLSLCENYPKEFFYSCLNILGSHDTERLMTIFLGRGRSEERAKKLIKLARLIQVTIPGVPCIYYGDEIGLRGGKDPENRKAYPWGFEDIDLLNHYNELIKIRNEEKALIDGDLSFLLAQEDLVLYVRSTIYERVYIAINRSLVNEACVNLDDMNKNLEFIYGNRIKDNERIIIQPLSGSVFKEVL